MTAITIIWEIAVSICYRRCDNTMIGDDYLSEHI